MSAVCDESADTARHPLIVAAAAQLLGAALLECFPSNVTADRALLASPSVPPTFRNAVSFIHAHTGDGIGVNDIAAAVRLTPRAVQYLFRQVYPLKGGETILYHAAAGGVGLIACQWARALGVTMIGTVSTDTKAEMARAHGCAHTIVTSRENIAERVREITGGSPYGASSITGPFTEMRMPTPLELDMCRFQGEHVTRIASHLVAGARSAA